MEEEKEVKEEKQKKSHTGILVCIIIILIILLGVCIFLLFQEKNNNSSRTTKDTEEKGTKKEATEQTKEEKLESISLDDTMVVKLDKLNPKMACGQTNLILEKRNRNVNEISSVEKIRMIMGSDDLEKSDDEKATISEESIKKYFEDTSFLEKYKNGFPQGENLGYNPYTDVLYENNQLSFIKKTAVGCEGPHQGSFLKLYSAKKNSNKLVLNYISYYTQADREENNTFIFKYYKDDTKTEYLGEGKEYKELDPSLFSGYQFVFNIEDGNHLLEAINYLSTVTEG